MMITSKGGVLATKSHQLSQYEQQECCMCGDFGLSYELFNCKICQFRSQHRYCSNIYPKGQSYTVCNWCLNDKEDTTDEKTQNSFNSYISNKSATSDRIRDDVIKTKKKHIGNSNNFQRSNSMIKNEKGSSKLNVNNHSIIKKQKSPERSLMPILAARKRISTSSNAIQRESIMKRTKSEEISYSGMKKHIFKNRVRRYKLLNEVSC